MKKKLLLLGAWRNKHTVYSSLWFSKFTKKLLSPCVNSTNLLLKAFKLLKLQKNYSGIFLFYEILETGKPLMATKKIRRGKQIYDVPNPITFQSAYDLSLRHFVGLIKNYAVTVNVATKLFLVISEFLYSPAQVVLSKNELHKKVTANRAYLHFRW